MKKQHILLTVGTLFFLGGCASKPTAELAPFTEKIVDMFIAADMCEPGSSIGVTAYWTEHNWAWLHVYTQPDEHLTSGNYCGCSFYKGHKVELWGESINDYFWMAKEPSRFIEKDTAEIYSCYDPCDWYICIDMSDTTVRPSLCYFPCDFPFPIDTLSEVLNESKKK